MTAGNVLFINSLCARNCFCRGASDIPCHNFVSLQEFLFVTNVRKILKSTIIATTPTRHCEQSRRQGVAIFQSVKLYFHEIAALHFISFAMTYWWRDCRTTFYSVRNDILVERLPHYILFRSQ